MPKKTALIAKPVKNHPVEGNASGPSVWSGRRPFGDPLE